MAIDYPLSSVGVSHRQGAGIRWKAIGMGQEAATVEVSEALVDDILG